MRKLAANRQKKTKMMNTSASGVRSKSFQYSGITKVNKRGKMASTPQGHIGRFPHMISDLTVIGIISIPVLLIMIVIYILSNIFFS
jgi:hypothetical protein